MEINPAGSRPSGKGPAEYFGGAIDPAMREFLKDQPIGRMGRPEEAAAAVLWLCSPAASLALGVALPVDGGFTAH